MSELVPTDRELEALKVIWERGKATVREIWELLRSLEPELAYTSVLSLLQSMEQKGIVRHEAEGRAYQYFAVLQPDRTYQRLAARFLDRVFDGAVDQYLVRALESRPPSMDELKKLEQLIQAAKTRPAGRPKKGGKR